MLAGGAIFAGEFEARDFCVADFALLGSLWGEVLDVGIGECRAGLAIEDEGFDFLARFESQGYVTAIVEGFFERLANIFIAGEFGNSTFKLLMFSARREFQRFDLFKRIFQHFRGHALVSSKTCAGFSIWTNVAGP